MPHLRIRGVDQQQAESLSFSLPQILAEPLSIKPSAVPLEWISSQLLINGQTQLKPLLEVHWFARPQAQQDQIAQVLTHELNRVLGSKMDYSVVFYVMDKSAYYRNGQHFG
ncbi:DUF1904 family protein [Pelagibaculum spongiae]|uniref:DUF1904 domain-containing protein n=1 Tax=Pelagibaculum spongiae TaxID=2080658 RepID=A0A2V1GVU5_9GAMM|nr:DUF1904 family protein [Pelagibaculum spongiae]PVZ63931.1 DUF1904 domain-containing protein [Pelagibaculum spongiae]